MLRTTPDQPLQATGVNEPLDDLCDAIEIVDLAFVKLAERYQLINPALVDLEGDLAPIA